MKKVGNLLFPSVCHLKNWGHLSLSPKFGRRVVGSFTHSMKNMIFLIKCGICSCAELLTFTSDKKRMFSVYWQLLAEPLHRLQSLNFLGGTQPKGSSFLRSNSGRDMWRQDVGWTRMLLIGKTWRLRTPPCSSIFSQDR